MIESINKKRKTHLSTKLWIIFFVLTPPVIGYLIQGPKIFSSISYYFTYTSIGYAYGIFFGIGNSLIGFYTKKLDWSKNPKRANLVNFFIFIGYGIIMSILIPYTIDVYLWDMSGVTVLYDVSFKAFITIVADLIIFYLYYSTFIANHWIKSIEKNEELKRENLVAKYEALKNQVNPHFLFNSLNTLSGIVEQKPELATGFIKKLSDIYRYVLEKSDKELVMIQDEMKFVEDYIFLSRMRFGEALVFKTVLPENPFQVVPLGLQMLVENAIKHNIISDDMPLKIEIAINEKSIIVKNNIQKKNTVISDMESIGLANLKNRYAYLSDVAVEVSESENEFIVKLPVINV